MKNSKRAIRYSVFLLPEVSDWNFQDPSEISDQCGSRVLLYKSEVLSKFSGDFLQIFRHVIAPDLCRKGCGKNIFRDKSWNWTSSLETGVNICRASVMYRIFFCLVCHLSFKFLGFIWLSVNLIKFKIWVQGTSEEERPEVSVQSLLDMFSKNALDFYSPRTFFHNIHATHLPCVSCFL